METTNPRECLPAEAGEVSDERQGWIFRVAELLSAAMLFAMMSLVCATVVTRYAVNAAIPDAFDLSRLVLGIAVFWGIVAACARDEQIMADILAPHLPPRARALVDVFGKLVLLGFLVLVSWKLLDKVFDVAKVRLQTSQLHLALWPFYSVAWLGTVVAVAAVGYRISMTLRTLVPRSISHEQTP